MNGVYFFVGAPGVGKTTLIRELLDPPSCYFVMKPKWTVGPKVVAAGHYTGGPFDGADTVPYNGVNEALAFWEHQLSKHPLTIFDGDRFSHSGVVEFFAALRVPMRCIELVASDEVLAARRAARGSKQNASWMKGRATKSANFADLFEDNLRIAADKTPARLAKDLIASLGKPGD